MKTLKYQFMPSKLTDPQIAVLTSLIPIGTMAAGAAVGNTVSIPSEVAACFSYMTTGLLVALVSIELMPEIFEQAKLRKDKTGAAVGFAIGAALLVGLLAGVETEKKKDVESATNAGHDSAEKDNTAVSTKHAAEKKEEEEAPKPFPAAAVTAFLILLWMYGLIIGIGMEVAKSQKAAIALALVTASTLGLDTFLAATENAELLKERGRPWWESVVVDVSGAVVLILGAFLGGEMESMKHHSNNGAPGFFFILGIAVAASLSVISEAQQSVVEKEASPQWYPPIFLYVGFLVILLIQWYAKQFKEHM